jgi:hypothetical protein
VSCRFYGQRTHRTKRTKRTSFPRTRLVRKNKSLSVSQLFCPQKTTCCAQKQHIVRRALRDVALDKTPFLKVLS